MAWLAIDFSLLSSAHLLLLLLLQLQFPLSPLQRMLALAGGMRDGGGETRLVCLALTLERRCPCFALSSEGCISLIEVGLERAQLALGGLALSGYLGAQLHELRLISFVLLLRRGLPHLECTVTE